MNSIIEVSPNIIALIGSVGVSEFRLNQLIQTINSEEITDISCREIYFCELNDCLSKFTENEISRLSNLLNANENIYDLEESFFFITPRIGTISPWSSKATDIAKNCGLSSVKDSSSSQNSRAPSKASRNNLYCSWRNYWDWWRCSSCSMWYKKWR